MNFLFDIDTPTAPKINGLNYAPNFITAEEEREILSHIDQQPWLNDLKRRVQHYGYKYDYKARAISKDTYLGPLPEWLSPAIKNLPFSPDQAIINEYEPGQGISAHTDCIPCFDNTIASLSLGSAATMQFSKENKQHELYLQPRSLVTLSNEARFAWKHAIPPRKSDTINGIKTQRQRRISVTFRKTII